MSLSKNAYVLIRIFLFISVAFLLTCEEQTFDNPYDLVYKIEPVQGFNAVQDGEHIILTWQRNEDVKTGYIIERKAPGDLDFSVLVDSLSHFQTTFVDSFIITDAVYVYKIRGHSGNNNSPYSDLLKIVTKFPRPIELILTPISDILLKLEWNDSSSFQLGRIIERSSNGYSYINIATIWDNIDYYIDTVYLGIQYSYRMKYFTNHNISQYSDSVNGSTFFKAPEGFDISHLSSTSVKLFWDDGYNYEDGYIIEKSERNEGFIQIADLPPNTDSLIVNDLDSVDTYIFRVKAYTKFNFSNYSEMSVAFNKNYMIINEFETPNATRVISFSPNGKILIVGGGSGDGIWIWDTSNWSKITTISDFNGNINSVDFSPNSQLLAVATDNFPGEVRILKVTDWSTIHTFPEASQYVKFSNDGNYFMYAGVNLIRVWDSKNWNNIIDVQTGGYYGAWINSIDFSNDNKYMACALDIEVRIWNISDWSLNTIIKDHTGKVNSVAFSPLKNILASGSWDGTIRVWEAPDWSSLIDPLSISANLVKFTSNGLFFAGGDKIWDTNNWNIIQTFSQGLYDFDFSPNGRFLASNSNISGNIVIIYRKNTWQKAY